MKPLPVLVAVMIALLAQPAQAAAPAKGKRAGEMGIAAVVGQDAISDYDVQRRMRFVIATSNLSDTPEVIERIRPQVTYALIDEELQLQEAERNGITVTDDEIKQAITTIETERNMPPGGIYALMDAKNVPRETFTNQIRAQLSWNKLMAKTVRPKLRASEEEIRDAMKRYVPPPKLNNADEMLIGLLILPVDKPSREPQVKAFADKIVNETRRGASFEELARQFASASGGSGTIEKFWVKPQSLEPLIARVLATAQVGTVTPPLRNTLGYTLIKVYDMRTDAGSAKELENAKEVTVKEFLFRLKPEAQVEEAKAMLAISAEVSANPGVCTEKEVAGIQNLSEFDIEANIIKSTIGELTPAVRTIVSGLKAGGMSQPFGSKDGIRLYMLCDKRDPGEEPVTREMVYPRVMQQKMEQEAQKMMRALRRSAFIDVRQ